MRSQRSAHTPATASPPRRALGWLAGAVLLLHLAVLASLSGALDWQLKSPEATRVSPLQTRMITPPAPVLARAAPPQAPLAARPRTRVATEPAPLPAPTHTSVQEAETPSVTEVATAATGDKAPQQTTPEQAAPAAAPASEPVSTTVATASENLPLIPLGALPASTLLSYRLTGQEKGLTYHASGELRWQHNDTAYAMSLSVKAFLLGARHWRSVGNISAGGLAPLRFSDSWRSERAAHFDRANQRVVFSGNAPVAELLPGAQDQISLYAQLAAAMAGEPQRFSPGTRLQIQTITVRDAQPWLLTQEASEVLNVNDQAVQTAKWVCHPRNRFDAQVEFWVAEKYNWLPVRIRITQVSGNFIDLTLTGQEPLPTLPASTEKPPAS